MNLSMDLDWLIIDLGGSIIAPAPDSSNSTSEAQVGPDSKFSGKIIKFLCRWLEENPQRRVGLVVGGGFPARSYQQAVQSIAVAEQASSKDGLDWLGIRATHLNAEYLRLLITLLAPEGTLCQPLLMRYDQLPAPEKMGRIIVGGGWKPGFSTDYDAVLLAEHVGAERLVCLSNIVQIYDDDPKSNPAAQPLERLSWAGYQKIAGGDWTPGRSTPFDPVATAHAQKIGLELLFADGRNLANLECIVNGEPFIGTVIS